jgi:hypothetical protein
MAQRDKSTDEMDGTASDAANAKLKHSQGGGTTRDDATDVGVPMLQGDPSERQGPEDALGVGPKRGDYRARLARTDVIHHETRPVENAKAGEPTVVNEAQEPRAEDIGDAKGQKGGVDTDPLKKS